MDYNSFPKPGFPWAPAITLHSHHTLNCHSQGLSLAVLETWHSLHFCQHRCNRLRQSPRSSPEDRYAHYMPTMLPSQNVLLYLSTPQVGNELTCSANTWQVSKPKDSLPIENQLGRKYLMIKSLPLVCPQSYKISIDNCRGVKEIKLNSAYKAYIQQPEAM